jgi:hypothetical protein
MAPKRLGEHICCLYETDRELVETAGPFIAAGLAIGDKCSVVAGERSLKIISDRLSLAGIRTSEARRSSRLVMTPDIDKCPFSAAAASTIDLRDPGFSNRRMNRQDHRGYRSVFVVTDFLCDADERALLLREINLNSLMQSQPAVILLMYDKRHISDTVVADMLDIHPKIINCGTVYENPAYVLPEELL